MPLAVENIAALISWPGEEMTEGQFLYELADRTGVRLLIDVANLHTNHVNRGEDPAKALAELPAGGHRVRPCRGRLRTRRRLARQPRPPGPRAGPRHPDRPRVPGLPAGRAAGAGRELPRTGASWRRELEAIRGAVGRDGRAGRGGSGPAASGDGSAPCPARLRRRPLRRLSCPCHRRRHRGRPSAARARPGRPVVRARRRDARAGGVRPGAAGGAGTGARREAGGRRGQGRARAAGDPRRRLPGRLPRLRPRSSDDRRIPQGRAGLRRASAARRAHRRTPGPGGSCGSGGWSGRGPCRGRGGRAVRLARAARRVLLRR